MPVICAAEEQQDRHMLRDRLRQDMFRRSDISQT